MSIVIEYDKPVEMPSSIVYDEVMKNMQGVVAGRFNSKTGKYEIKLWMMRYKNYLQKILEKHHR